MDFDNYSNFLAKCQQIQEINHLFQEAYLEMYALYVKNKPTSDRLLAESGKFFQTKQIELGDKMDLASYLLKPVQRLGKYSLFLDGISKTTKQKTELLKAKKIIQFQVSFGRSSNNYGPNNGSWFQKYGSPDMQHASICIQYTSSTISIGSDKVRCRNFRPKSGSLL